MKHNQQGIKSKSLIALHIIVYSKIYALQVSKCSTRIPPNITGQGNRRGETFIPTRIPPNITGMGNRRGETVRAIGGVKLSYPHFFKHFCTYPACHTPGEVSIHHGNTTQLNKCPEYQWYLSLIHALYVRRRQVCTDLVDVFPVRILRYGVLVEVHNWVGTWQCLDNLSPHWMVNEQNS